MAPTLHSKFGASGAHRWVECPGSIQMVEKYGGDTGGEAADEGTLAHELGEALLRHPEYPPETEDIVPWVIGIVKESERWKEEYAEKFNYREMLSVALRYRDFCQGNDSSFKTEYIEMQVAMPRIDESAFGTNDHALVDLNQRHAIITDLKYGQGVRVPAKNNYQILQYAEGVRQRIKDDHGIELKTFEGRIFQPRAKDGENIDLWYFDLPVVEDYVHKAHTSAQLAKTDDPPLVPGDKTCQWCPAKGACPALADYMSDRLKHDFPDLDEAIEQYTTLLPAMSDEDLALWLGRIKPVNEWLAAIKTQATKRALEGHNLPGYKLGVGRNSYKPDEALLAVVVGDDAYKPPALRSKSDLEKTYGKALIDGCYTAVEGQPSLVPESSKVATYEAADADDFDDL